MAKTKRRKLPAEFLKRIWTTIQPGEWLNLLNRLAPANEWKMKGPTLIQGNCPYHDETKPSFTINFSKSYAKCFGASCGKFESDLIALVAHLKKCNYTEAFVTIKTEFGEATFEGFNEKEMRAYHSNQVMKKQAAEAMNKVLVELITEGPERLDYLKPALAYLTDVRRIAIEALPLIPVGVFAKPIHLKVYIDKSLHVQFDEYFDEQIQGGMYGAITFPYNDALDRISCFKFLLRNLDIPIENVERAPLTTKTRLFGKENSFFTKREEGDPVGVFGLQQTAPVFTVKDPLVYLTEGEFDVLSIAANQQLAGDMDFGLLGISGTGSTNLSLLRELKVQTIWLIPDAPHEKGDYWANKVLKTKENFVSSIRQPEMKFKIFNWPKELKGGDLDESVQLDSYAETYKHIFLDRANTFSSAVLWVQNKVNVKLQKVTDRFVKKIANAKNREEVLLEEKEAKVNEILLGFSVLVHTSYKEAYTQYYIDQHKIDLTSHAVIANSIMSLNTVEGVVQRVKECFSKEIVLSYYTTQATTTQFFGWSRKKEELVPIVLKQEPLEDMSALYLGDRLESWFDMILPDNEIYLSGLEGKDPLEASFKKVCNASAILQQSIRSLYSDVPNRNGLTLLSQGIHHLDLTEQAKKANSVFFVNGTTLLKGSFPEEGETMFWEQLNNIVVDGNLFEGLNKGDAWSAIKNVADMAEANKSSSREVYEQLLVILDGWKFKAHHLVRRYLAVYIMSLPIMRAMGNINITMLVGMSESGKTTFSEGLLGGNKRNAGGMPTVLESSYISGNSSAAAMYQQMDGRSATLIIDEAEVSNEHTAKSDDQLKDIIRLLYGMPQEGANIKRGGMDRTKHSDYFLRFPVLLSAINLHPNSVFLSRVFVISTEKDRCRKNVELYVKDKFSAEQLQKLRTDITGGLIPQIPKLMKEAVEVRKKLNRIALTTASVSNRFTETVLTPMTVYESMGFDSGELYRGLILADKERLEAVHASVGTNEVLDACFYTPYIEVDMALGGGKFTNIRNKLSDNDEVDSINILKSGIYIMDEEELIVVVWRQVKFTALYKTPYHRMLDGVLREKAQRSDSAVKNISEEMHNLIIQSFELGDVKSVADYTVIRRDYLDFADKHKRENQTVTGEGFTFAVGKDDVASVIIDDSGTFSI